MLQIDTMYASNRILFRGYYVKEHLCFPPYYNLFYYPHI
jgi:hypothetical protein